MATDAIARKLAMRRRNMQRIHTEGGNLLIKRLIIDLHGFGKCIYRSLFGCAITVQASETGRRANMLVTVPGGPGPISCRT